MADFTEQDARHMQRALALALRGQGRVEPNPMVGCVLVAEGRVVGEGRHRRFGGPHAEIEALRVAGSRARGATCLVTLEPCCHVGKTGPCTTALIQAGIARVIVAMHDPFPPVRGRGIRTLRDAGMAVESGLLEAQAAALNAPYLKRLDEGRPWVILKWAQSLDGRIATRTGDSQWISGPASRRRGQRLRGRVDAVVVGVGTVLADDPLLTCRDAPARRTARRVVLDPHLRMPERCRLIGTCGDAPTVIVTTPLKKRTPKAHRLQKRGAILMGIRTTRAGFDLGQLLDKLGQAGMTNILVEGGGETLGRFLDERLADEAYVFVAPLLIGGREAVPALAGLGPATLDGRVFVKDVRIAKSGPDRMYHLLLDRVGAAGKADGGYNATKGRRNRGKGPNGARLKAGR